MAFSERTPEEQQILDLVAEREVKSGWKNILVSFLIRIATKTPQSECNSLIGLSAIPFHGGMGNHLIVVGKILRTYLVTVFNK